MAVLTNFTIGDRIKYYRDQRGLSQKTLGELVGRTENWVWKVEHGQLPVDRVPLLMDLARVLRIKDIADLTGGFLKAATADMDAEHPAVFAIRRALSLPPSSLDAGADSLSVQDLSAEVDEAWTVYETATRRYAQVGDQLPVLLSRAYGTLRDASSEQENLEATRVLVSLYGLHQIWLRRVGERTLARVAADRSLALADTTGDPVLRSAAAWNLSCVFTSSGDVENSIELARDMIANCAPAPDSSTEHRAVFGALHLQGAVAAVRANKGPVAWDLFTSAQQIAEQTGEHNGYWHMCFGPTNVAMHSVHLAAEEGDANEALRRADSVEVSDLIPLERRTRYMIEVMNCNRIQHDDYGTVFMLKRLMDQSPEEITYSPVVRDAVADLLKREKPVWRQDLRTVAKHVGLAA
jgi:transcriptional regulator with XRE-family HTH domain